MKAEFSNLKILVVEDNESNIMFFKSAFKRTGATLLIALDGEQAIDIVITNPDIDIILMDIHMPKMNGLEAAKAIKTIDPNLPIIFQTAYVLDYKQKQCEEAGGDFFLEKPIRIASLYDSIKELIIKK